LTDFWATWSYEAESFASSPNAQVCRYLIIAPRPNVIVVILRKFSIVHHLGLITR